jgi:hypothetical protein
MKRILGCAAVVVCVACGCGKRTTTVTGPDGVKVTVDKSGGKVEIKGQGADGTIATFSESGVTLPDDFPKDLPLYPGAVPTLHTTVKNNRSVMLKTTDAADKVAAFYKEKLKAEGWKIEAEFAIGDTASLSGTKDRRTLAVVVAHDGKGAQITLGLTTNDKPNPSNDADEQ